MDTSELRNSFAFLDAPRESFHAGLVINWQHRPHGDRLPSPSDLPNIDFLFDTIHAVLFELEADGSPRIIRTSRKLDDYFDHSIVDENLSDLRAEIAGKWTKLVNRATERREPAFGYTRLVRIPSLAMECCTFPLSADGQTVTHCLGTGLIVNSGDARFL